MTPTVNETVDEDSICFLELDWIGVDTDPDNNWNSGTTKDVHVER